MDRFDRYPNRNGRLGFKRQPGREHQPHVRPEIRLMRGDGDRHCRHRFNTPQCIERPDDDHIERLHSHASHPKTGAGTPGQLGFHRHRTAECHLLHGHPHIDRRRDNLHTTDRGAGGRASLEDRSHLDRNGRSSKINRGHHDIHKVHKLPDTAHHHCCRRQLRFSDLESQWRRVRVHYGHRERALLHRLQDHPPRIPA